MEFAGFALVAVVLVLVVAVVRRKVEKPSEYDWPPYIPPVKDEPTTPPGRQEPF